VSEISAKEIVHVAAFKMAGFAAGLMHAFSPADFLQNVIRGWF